MSEEVKLNLEEHELFWMFSDAVWLYHSNRKFSSLLLLLCAVDAFAARRLPDKRGQNRERFTEFLRTSLPRYTRVENFFITIPKHKREYRLEDILYQFLRNPMVHEGACLNVGDGDAVSVDWTKDAPAIHTSSEGVSAHLGGDWVVDTLGSVIQDCIVQDLMKRHIASEAMKRGEHKMCYEFRLLKGPLDGVYTAQDNGKMLGPGFNPRQLGMNAEEVRKHAEGMEESARIAHMLYEKHRDANEGDEINIRGHNYQVVERMVSTENQYMHCHTWTMIRCNYAPAP